MRIGEFFSKRARANAGSGWAISEITPGFQMSVGGRLSLTTMAGFVTARIDFLNQSF
jgi:hypothetical protein